ncbi:MAG: DUF1116 domain-containing protein [Bacteroidota bacterium]|nr:DUF1116 domain-containing protein [Bacteroidota bacterium]
MSQKIKELFSNKTSVINVGIETFHNDLRNQGVESTHVSWKPPASGNTQLVEILASLYNEKVDEANAKVIEIISNGHPKLVGLGNAKDAIPGLTSKTFLHAGPPVTWKRMCGPMRGAVIGGLIYEGLAKDVQEAEAVAAKEINFNPCHHFHAVGPMAGVLTPSMPVWIVKNETYGNYAYATMNEGLGKVLRFGAYGPEVIKHLNWMRDELYPLLRESLEIKGTIDLRLLIAQALQMGDECHNRNKALTSLFYREIAPAIVRTNFSDEQKAKVLEFINSNDHFGLNLSMPAAKSIMEPIEGIENSTIVSTMARNGTEFGIRIAGMKGKWYTAKSPHVKGLYFPGYTENDAALDIGDSVITETSGFGGFAMAAAPAIVGFVGGKPSDAINFTQKMYQITMMESKFFQIPALGFRGTPTAIDIRKVIESGILPIVNTGIAHKDAGVGQIGAGLVNPPMECFEKALLSLSTM